MPDAVRYRIGPLTTYAAPEELRAWHDRADAGHQCIYAIGPRLDPDNATRRLAFELGANGEARLLQRRCGRGFEYVIAKAGASPRGDVRQGAIPGRTALAHEALALLEVVAACVEAGEDLPSNEVLAERALLPDRHAARYRLGQLVSAGLVVLHRDGAARRVEIVEGVGP